MDEPARRDAAPDAAEPDASLDAGECTPTAPFASLPGCDAEAFWELEPTRCFVFQACQNCATSGAQPFAGLCFQPTDEVLGEPTRICGRRSIAGGPWEYFTWRHNPLPPPSPATPEGLRVRGFYGVPPTRAEFRAVYGPGDFSEVRFDFDRARCDLGSLVDCLGQPVKIAEVASTVRHVGLGGLFADAERMHLSQRVSVASPNARDLVYVEERGTAWWLEGEQTLAAAVRSNVEPPEVARAELPTGGAPRLLRSPFESVLIVDGASLSEARAWERGGGFELIVSEPELLLEAAPDDVFLSGTVLVYRALDRVYAFDLGAAEPRAVDPALMAGVRRIVPGALDSDSFDAARSGWALIDTAWVRFELDAEGRVRATADREPLLTDADDLIGITQARRQVGSAGISTVLNPFGADDVRFEDFYGGRVLAVRFEMGSDNNLVGSVAVARSGGGSVVFESGEVHPDACGW